MSKDQNLLGQIEAVLFCYGEEMPLKKLASILKIDTPHLENSLKNLENRLTEINSGLVLLNKNDTVQLVSSPDFAETISDLVKKEYQEDLTPASEETLAIIAYSGPLSRSEIEYIRGANSSFTIRNLLMRGLLDRNPDPKNANVFLYNLSSDCLRHLGLTRLSELPEYEKYRSFADKIFERAKIEDKNSEV